MKILSFAIMGSFLWGCTERSFLTLPITPPSVEESRFGVVSLPYLGLSSDLGIGEQIVTLRTGDIVRIDAVRVRYDVARGIWLDHYRVITDNDQAGWTTGEFLELFRYVQAAKNYCKLLRAKRLDQFDE